MNIDQYSNSWFEYYHGMIMENNSFTLISRLIKILWRYGKLLWCLGMKPDTQKMCDQKSINGTTCTHINSIFSQWGLKQ